MNLRKCHLCGCEFSGGEEFCPRDGTRLSAPKDGEQVAIAPAAIAAREQPDPLVGTTLDARYKILRMIGEGGMGVVYEALHVMIEKHVAIKVLRDTFTSRPDVVERFRQEAKSASKIGHPNIVDVSDFGETPSGQSYIVMEMLTGEDVADVLSRERVLSAPRAVRIVYQVARALHATHKKGIVHRDLKPENIYLIECDGTRDIVKVVDFGVAKMNDIEVATGRKLTRTGMIFGTPEYMSPEQALGKPFDHRVDIYALGAILFELISGRVPFTGENFMEILAHHGHTPVPSLRSVNPTLSVSPALEAIVKRALVKDPAERYQTMGEFADDLRSLPEMPASERADVAAPALWSLSSGAHMQSDSIELRGLDALASMSHRSSRSFSEFNPSPVPRTGDTPPPLPVVRRTPSPSPVAVKVTRASEISQRLPRYETLSFDEAQAAVLISEGQPWPVRVGMRLGLLGLIVAGTLLVAFVFQRMNARPVSTSSSSSFDEPLQPTAAQERAPEVQAEPPVQPQIHAQTQPPGPLEHLDVADPAIEPLSALDASNLVEVQVRTQPAGASVSAVGTDARCNAAPCALAVPRGRPITLRAETQTASVERTLTFEEKSEVELRINHGRRGQGAKKHHDNLGKEQATAPRGSNDLKIPSIFR